MENDKAIDVIKRLMADFNVSLKDLEDKEEVVIARWRAVRSNEYAYLNDLGNIARTLDYDNYHDVEHYKIGNYFKTKDDAEKSLIYFAFNDDYEYWFPWMGEDCKPSEQPTDPQSWEWEQHCWSGEYACDDVSSWRSFIYRWPKHPDKIN